MTGHDDREQAREGSTVRRWLQDRRREEEGRFDVVGGVVTTNITDRLDPFQADSQELLPVRASATWRCP